MMAGWMAARAYVYSQLTASPRQTNGPLALSRLRRMLRRSRPSHVARWRTRSARAIITFTVSTHQPTPSPFCEPLQPLALMDTTPPRRVAGDVGHRARTPWAAYSHHSLRDVWPVEITLATENALEVTDGMPVTSRCGSLLPSALPDTRSLDDGIAF